MVQRSLLLERLEKWRGKPIVKVLTGVRRCGKSVLLKQFQEALLASGVAPDRIVSVDFEDLSNEFGRLQSEMPLIWGRRGAWGHFGLPNGHLGLPKLRLRRAEAGDMGDIRAGCGVSPTDKV